MEAEGDEESYRTLRELSKCGNSVDNILLAPGPFPTGLLDQEISSDDTEYCPSRRRDLPQQFDSIDTSSHSSISLGEYQRHRWHVQYQSEAVSSPSAKASSDATGDSFHSAPFSLGSTTILDQTTQELVGMLANDSTGTLNPRDGVIRDPSTSSLEASDSSCYTPSVANDSNSLPTTTAVDSDASFDFHQASFRRRPSANCADRWETESPLISLPRDDTSCKQKPSEVQGMLDFLQDRGKGMTGQCIALEILGFVPLPMSAETSGWLQQNSSAEDSIADQGGFSRYSQNIPYNEQDDPPDSDISSLP